MATLQIIGLAAWTLGFPGCRKTPGTEVELWPEGAPGAKGDEQPDRPTLTLFRPDKPCGAAMLVCPGGGYALVSQGPHETARVAAWLNSLGITAAFLRYRNAGGGYGHPAPLQDAQRALRLLRQRAAEWSLDAARIGILGFSAGGHLAATAATLFDARLDASGALVSAGVEPNPAAAGAADERSARPDFAALLYPVILTTGPYASTGTVRSLLGEHPTPAQLTLLSPDRQVTARTPPVFLGHARDDSTVPPANSQAFYDACQRNGVPAELHLYPSGGHGFGIQLGASPTQQWTVQCTEWLKRLHVLT